MQNTALKSTILVVDDEPANLRVLKHLLAEHYTLAFAKNGPEALRVASPVTGPYFTGCNDARYDRL